MRPSRLPKLQRRPRPPTPNSVIFKAILRLCVIICDIAWHVPEDFRSLHYRCSFAPSSLHFCLIKKPNHADGSERITSRSLRMFEDAKATGGNTCWWLLVLKPTLFYLFFNFNLCSFILINLNHIKLSGVSNPKKSGFSITIIAAVLCLLDLV